ncbi:MAG: molybdenum ABC transporter substrate-binding protein [Proteobacteria bacterium]|nr:MAG: molybdenum ABC transporter substrate-binding protein [Pseudomonadota bacterium]
MSSTALKVISSMATRQVLADLAAQYQSVTGRPVATEAAGGVDVAKRVRQGEAFDVVILASDVIDKLIAEERLRAPRVDVVKSAIAVAVRAGAARPRIATEEDVKRAVETARSVSYSTGPSGTYLEKTFERWGILDALRSRIVVPPPGVPVASLVADGQAEIGFQQLSELMNRPGVDVLGPLPSEIQSLTFFSGGVSTACADPAAARALLDYLASPDTAAVKQRYGLESAT